MRIVDERKTIKKYNRTRIKIGEREKGRSRDIAAKDPTHSSGVKDFGTSVETWGSEAFLKCHLQGNFSVTAHCSKK